MKDYTDTLVSPEKIIHFSLNETSQLVGDWGPYIDIKTSLFILIIDHGKQEIRLSFEKKVPDHTILVNERPVSPSRDSYSTEGVVLHEGDTLSLTYSGTNYNYIISHNSYLNFVLQNQDNPKERIILETPYSYFWKIANKTTRSFIPARNLQNLKQLADQFSESINGMFNNRNNHWLLAFANADK